jgi:hypothetical protein
LGRFNTELGVAREVVSSRRNRWSCALDTHTLCYFVVFSVAPLERNWSAKDELAAWLGDKRNVINTGRKASRLTGLETIEQLAERETLVLLMATIKAASKRKAMILQSLEKFNGLIGELPHMIDVGRRDTQQLYGWLIANLQLTNHALDTALVYLHALYGKAFSKK